MSEPFKQPTLDEGAAQDTQQSNAELRTDGPTLAEYIAAGYDPETYPPEGYASRDAPPAPKKWEPRAEPTHVKNAGKTDELSRAVIEAARPKPTELKEPVRPPGKYFLHYEYNGEEIKESHATIPHALARIAALKRIGIVPGTSTAA